MEFWKSKLGISDYGVAWIAFLKGLLFGLFISKLVLEGGVARLVQKGDAGGS